MYSTGVYFGGGLALMIGGSVIRAVSSAPSIQLPILGEIYAWQATFFVVGAIGLPVLLLMFTIREPARRGLRAVSADAKIADSPSAWPALRAFLRANARTVSCHIAAFSLYGIAIGSYQFWSPSFMMRSHGWTAPEAGLTIGALMFVLGTAGVSCGGWFADRLAVSGRRDAILRAAFIGMACGLPFIIATPLVGDDRLATVGLGIAIFFLAFPQGLPAAALQVMTPNPLRAQMSALYFFIGSLIASGIGPMLPAMLTDYVFKEPVMLRYSVVHRGRWRGPCIASDPVLRPRPLWRERSTGRRAFGLIRPPGVDAAGDLVGPGDPAGRVGEASRFETQNRKSLVNFTAIVRFAKTGPWRRSCVRRCRRRRGRCRAGIPSGSEGWCSANWSSTCTGRSC